MDKRADQTKNERKILQDLYKQQFYIQQFLTFQQGYTPSFGSCAVLNRGFYIFEEKFFEQTAH